jgi:4-amino-4-deoxy-L-arabinose transferase-like glycosyltransferase
MSRVNLLPNRMSHRPFLSWKTWLPVLLLVGICGLLLLPGLNSSTTSRQQELRVLLCARDMAEGGDWVVPHFLGQERLRKPPLMYWLVALAFRAAGTTESLGAARAVSVVCATGLVLATFVLGRRLIGRKAALLGSLVLATSIGFLYHGRLAETDIPQALFCSLTIFMLYEAMVAGRFSAWLLAGVFGGLGFMIKGPASLAMPLAAALSYALVTKKWHASAPGVALADVSGRRIAAGVGLALLLGACLVAPWYLMVATRTAATTSSQVSNEMTRLLTDSSHEGPFIFYLYTLPVRMGVWLLAVPVAVFAAWKRLRHHRGARWLLCWLGSSFLILSSLSSKQNHYALLLFVPAALLTGWLLSCASRRVARGLLPAGPARRARLALFCASFARNYLRTLLFLLGLAAGAGFVAWLLGLPQNMPVILALVSVPVTVFVIVMLRCHKARVSPLSYANALVLAIALGGFCYKFGLEKMLDGDSAVPGLVKAHQQTIQAARRILVSGDHRAPVEWYTRRSCVLVPPLAAGALDQLKPGDVLIASEKEDPLRPRPTDPAPVEKRQLGDVEVAIYVR